MTDEELAPILDALRDRRVSSIATSQVSTNRVVVGFNTADGKSRAAVVPIAELLGAILRRCER